MNKQRILKNTKKIFSILLILLAVIGSSKTVFAFDNTLFRNDDVFLGKNYDLESDYYELKKIIQLNDTDENFFIEPCAMAFDKKYSRLLVGDYLSGKIYEYDTKTYKRKGEFGLNYYSPKKLFGKISSIFISRESDLYFVSDSQFHRILIFNNYGIPQKKFGSVGDSFMELSEPGGVCLDDRDKKDKKLYISDRYNCRICVYNNKPRFLYSFASKGINKWQLYLPGPLLLSNERDLYICDTGNDMIKIFDTAGVYLKSIGSKGRQPGEFNGIADICFDSADNIYAADSLNSRIQKFNKNGEYIGEIKNLNVSFLAKDYFKDFFYRLPNNLDSNEVATSIGQLKHPISVKVDSAAGLVYVLDSERKEILIFEGNNFEKGRKLYISKDYKNAIKYLEKVYKRIPENINALYYLAYSLQEIGKTDDAYNKYFEILKKNHNNLPSKYARLQMKKIAAQSDNEKFQDAFTKQINAEVYKNENIIKMIEKVNKEQQEEPSLFEVRRKKFIPETYEVLIKEKTAESDESDDNNNFEEFKKNIMGNASDTKIKYEAEDEDKNKKEEKHIKH